MISQLKEVACDRCGRIYHSYRNHKSSEEKICGSKDCFERSIEKKKEAKITEEKNEIIKEKLRAREERHARLSDN